MTDKKKSALRKSTYDKYRSQLVGMRNVADENEDLILESRLTNVISELDSLIMNSPRKNKYQSNVDPVRGRQHPEY